METVDTVRRMVDSGTALAVMGNHEFNAIAWYLPDPENPGEYLRPHNSDKYKDRNFKQHQAFLAEIKNKDQHSDIIKWFMTLPLWLELPELRVVHACWHTRYMDLLSPKLSDSGQINEELMIEASREPGDKKELDNGEYSFFKGIETVLKGIEIPLPAGYSFADKDGTPRDRVRVRWWNPNATTYRSGAMLPDEICRTFPTDPIPRIALAENSANKLTFFGHYWLDGNPVLLSEKATCLDYSIGKGGKLVAYRWDGEPTLDAGKFAWVDAK